MNNFIADTESESRDEVQGVSHRKWRGSSGEEISTSLRQDGDLHLQISKYGDLHLQILTMHTRCSIKCLRVELPLFPGIR